MQGKPGWVPCAETASGSPNQVGLSCLFIAWFWGSCINGFTFSHIKSLEPEPSGHWRMARIKMEMSPFRAWILCLRMSLFRWVLCSWPGMTEFMQNELTELNPLQGKPCVLGLWLGRRGSGTLDRRRKQWVNDKNKKINLSCTSFVPETMKQSWQNTHFWDQDGDEDLQISTVSRQVFSLKLSGDLLTPRICGWFNLPKTTCTKGNVSDLQQSLVSADAGSWLWPNTHDESLAVADMRTKADPNQPWCRINTAKSTPHSSSSGPGSLCCSAEQRCGMWTGKNTLGLTGVYRDN